ncbi:transposase [Celeribacter sp. ULVN23_4]
MTKKHRRHSTAKKREVVEAYFQNEARRALSQKYDICRTLIPIWAGYIPMPPSRLVSPI